MMKQIILSLFMVNSLSFAMDGMDQYELYQLPYTQLESMKKTITGKITEFDQTYPNNLWEKNATLRAERNGLDEQLNQLDNALLLNVRLQPTQSRRHNNDSRATTITLNSSSFAMHQLPKRKIKLMKRRPAVFTESAAFKANEQAKNSIKAKLEALDLEETFLLGLAENAQGEILKNIAEKLDAIEKQRGELMKNSE